MRIVAGSPMNAKVLRGKIARHDSLLAELSRLTDLSCAWTPDTSPRKVEAQIARTAKLQKQFRKISAIPEVKAAIFKRESKRSEVR